MNKIAILQGQDITVLQEQLFHYVNNSSLTVTQILQSQSSGSSGTVLTYTVIYKTKN